MKYISLTSRIMSAIKKSEKADLANIKNTADIDYIAMMTDVELDTSEVEEAEEFLEEEE